MNNTTEKGATPDNSEKNHFHQQYLNRKNNVLKGKVWSVNGRIFVKDGPQAIPTITLHENAEEVIIVKNGEVIAESIVEVTESDQISIETKEILVPPKCMVITDEEQLTAFIEVEPGYRLIRNLNNFSPTHQAVLTIQEQRVINEPLSVEEINNQLRKADITYGLNEENIKLAAQSKQHAVIEVAKGIPAQEGSDGFLEMQVESTIKRVLTADEKGNIDFRETRQIPTIEPGDILAVIHLSTPGKSGRSVKNKEIQPPPVMNIHFHAEKGVKLEENSITATKVGRPYIQQKNHVVKASVIPKFLQQENVNIATGNIRFYGDVEVVGEVEENMTVEAGNDIILHASVNSSVITATHSITCSGNISNSVLSAGEKNTVLVKLGKSMGMIAEQLETLVAVIEQITHSPNYLISEQKQSIRSILDFLLKKRFAEFKSIVKDYIISAGQNKEFLPVEWKVLAKELQEIFFTHSYLETTVYQLQGVLSAIQEIQEKNVLDFEEDSSITVASTLNSTLRCNGDVHIMGHGSLNTTIEAQGKVMISGLLRGGSVFAKEGVEIKEAGSTGGVRASVAVPEDKMIRIDLAHEGTELKVGPARLVLNQQQQNITALLNTEGQIVFK